MILSLWTTKMCMIKYMKMTSASAQSSVERLQFALIRQNAYYDNQIVKDLTADEFERYQSMRNACVHYIRGMRFFFDIKPEVFAMAVEILDVFLWKVKVTEKHMTVVSAGCFLLACKVIEEDEYCPTSRQLSSLPSHSWTANDLCRMEMHILKKLDWTLSSVTYLDFVSLLADLSGGNESGICFDSVISLAEKCITYLSTVQCKPFVLAFCLFQHMTGHLQDLSATGTNHLNIKEYEILQCKKALIDLSSPINALLSNIPVPRRSVSFPMKVFDKPSEIGSTCLPTICEE